MRRKICKEKCPFCHKNDETIIASSTQFRCKRCKKYFKKGTKRKEYSKEELIVIRTILELMYGNLNRKKISIKTFVKRILNNLNSTIHDIHFGGYTMPRAMNSLRPVKFCLGGKLAETIIITRQKDGFFVVRGLDVRNKIELDDFIINTSGKGNISRDYYFGIDDDHYK